MNPEALAPIWDAYAPDVDAFVAAALRQGWPPDEITAFLAWTGGDDPEEWAMPDTVEEMYDEL